MRPLVVGLLASALAAGCLGSEVEGAIRLGYFANLTHGQALLGVGTGLFAEALGETRLETQVFNAGPSAFEALFSSRLDATYVGPSPTISALSGGARGTFRVVAGAASGGAGLVVREGLVLGEAASFEGLTFASPQLGNTQDIALKHYLRSKGVRTTEEGGTVQVVNAANADILLMFQQGLVDGAWVPEPWLTRLEQEAGGRVELDERDAWPEGRFVTTHLVVRQEYLDRHPDVVTRLIGAHVNATLALRDADEATWRVVNQEIANATGKALPERVILAAAPHVEFTWDPLATTLQENAVRARALGLVEEDVETASVYDLSLLQAELSARGLGAVP